MSELYNKTLLDLVGHEVTNTVAVMRADRAPIGVASYLNLEKKHVI